MLPPAPPSRACRHRHPAPAGAAAGLLLLGCLALGTGTAAAVAGRTAAIRTGSSQPMSGAPVQIDDARVAILKSYPIQARLVLRGWAPEACGELRVGITYGAGAIDVTIGGCDPPTQGTSPASFQAVAPIPLRGLAEDRYVVRLDGRPLSDVWYPAGGPPGGGDAPAAAPDGEAEPPVDVETFAEIAWAASCASERNRLHLIDDGLVLWIRSDAACADAAWAATLYGTSPEDVRCRAGDSIAGPRLECGNPELQPLFEAALEALDGRRDAIGDGHAMAPLWAGLRVPLAP